VSGNNYLWLHKRSNPKSLMGVWFDETSLNEAKATLDNSNISYVQKDEKLRLTVDAQMIQSNAALFEKIANFVKDSWEE
jgi:hypothetical protein